MRPEDDYTHPVGPEPHFNESMYVHFHDPQARLGGFLRVANRPNEGRGEVTVCLFLPDGRLAFSYARPEVNTNDGFDAAGLRFVVREPLRHLDVHFDGTLHLLDDPALMADPKAAFTTSLSETATIDLVVRGVAPPFDHSFDSGEGSFAPNHYEQLLAAGGTVRIGDVEVAIRGYGLRDHSWGPRYWQTPWFYRWIHGAAEDLGFMGAWFGRPDGSAVHGGFVWDGGELHELDGLRITTARTASDEQDVVTAVLEAAGSTWTVTGRVQARVPLRNRRADADGTLRTTRIVEGLTAWTLADGRTLHGMSEYLDQIVDGRPVGLAV